MQNNIKKYFYLYSFFSSFLLFLPVLLLIYTKRNIDVNDMLLIEAFYYFSIFLFEIPTGILGDKIGHDKLVIIGLIGSIFSYLIFSQSFSLVMIICSQVLLGLFNSCISGSDQASLYDYLEKINEENKIEYQNGIYRISMSSMLFSFIISGFVLKIETKGILTFQLTAFFYFLATIFYILFLNLKKKSVNINSKISSSFKEKIPLKMFQYFNKDIIFSGILLGLILSTYAISQIYYRNFNVSPQVLGAIYCTGTILTIALNKLKFSFHRILLFLIPVVYFITIVNIKFFIVIFIMILSLIKSKVVPFIKDYVLSKSKDNKATNMSIMSLVNNVINVFIMVFLSRFIKGLGYTVGMLIISIIASLLVVYVYYKTNTSYKFAMNLKK